MRRALLPHLVEPETLSTLTIVPDETTPFLERGELVSSSGARYRVDRGIPSFVPKGAEDDQTIRSFAAKWEKHRYYREHTRSFYTAWYLARFGFGDEAGLATFLRDKRFVLDAGTGAGRDAANFARLSDATVFGVDTAWHALATASGEPERQTALAEGKNVVALVHADIHALPFRDGFFDYISCDQVIHHTPEPRAAFEALVKKLAPGGEIAVYVYRKKSVIREFTDDYVRDRIKHLSFEEALEITRGITKLGQAFAALGQKVTLEEGIPILGIERGEYDVQRFLHWHVLKCFWNDDFDFFTNNVVNADWYHPVHCHRFTPEELRAWFPEERWEIRAWDEQEAGISCRARRRGV